MWGISQAQGYLGASDDENNMRHAFYATCISIRVVGLVVSSGGCPTWTEAQARRLGLIRNVHKVGPNFNERI
jgi:hypothetical protein